MECLTHSNLILNTNVSPRQIFVIICLFLFLIRSPTYYYDNFT